MYYHYIVELHFISIIISRVSSRTADALSSDATKKYRSSQHNADAA